LLDSVAAWLSSVQGVVRPPISPSLVSCMPRPVSIRRGSNEAAGHCNSRSNARAQRAVLSVLAPASWAKGAGLGIGPSITGEASEDAVHRVRVASHHGATVCGVKAYVEARPRRPVTLERDRVLGAFKDAARRLRRCPEPGSGPP
jgi:hypothetical protein